MSATLNILIPYDEKDWSSELYWPRARREPSASEPIIEQISNIDTFDTQNRRNIKILLIVLCKTTMRSVEKLDFKNGNAKCGCRSNSRFFSMVRGGLAQPAEAA